MTKDSHLIYEAYREYKYTAADAERDARAEREGADQRVHFNRNPAPGFTVVSDNMDAAKWNVLHAGTDVVGSVFEDMGSNDPSEMRARYHASAGKAHTITSSLDEAINFIVKTYTEHAESGAPGHVEEPEDFHLNQPGENAESGGLETPPLIQFKRALDQVFFGLAKIEDLLIKNPDAIAWANSIAANDGGDEHPDFEMASRLMQLSTDLHNYAQEIDQYPTEP